MNAKSKLIVALDVPTFEEAKNLVDELGDAVDIYKVGGQMFTAFGPFAVRYLLAQGKQVFLDLKFHDIPNTVANCVRAAVALSVPPHDVRNEKGIKEEKYQSLLMMTVHTLGGAEMLKAAAQAAKEESVRLGVQKPQIIGVTVLTSQANEDNMKQLVKERALLAKESGLDGIVSSTHEVESLRSELGNDFVIVTPGIRPKDADAGDQKRVATPSEAIRLGSSYLVVGRPIVKANSPRDAALNILKEIEQA